MHEEARGLRKTPLNEVIRKAGAKLVDFAGWEMPVQFRSLIEEHLAVRSHAGLFDVSDWCIESSSRSRPVKLGLRGYGTPNTMLTAERVSTTPSGEGV